MNEDQNLTADNSEEQSPGDKEEVKENISQEQPVRQPLTINNEPLTNMEVHHHPDLHHTRKNFREYFLEGLMIFIAVTLGFFAENYREYLSDRSKEKELVANIYKQINSDSARLSYLINSYFPAYLNYVDTLSFLINESDKKIDQKQLIVTLFNTTNWDWFIPQLSGINEMKNSENVLQNKDALNVILKYDEYVNSYMQVNQNAYAIREGIDTALASVMDYKTELFLNNKMINQYSTLKKSFLTVEALPAYLTLISYDKEKLSKHLHKIKQGAILQGDVSGMYNLIFSKAVATMQVLRKEYPFLLDEK